MKGELLGRSLPEDIVVLVRLELADATEYTRFYPETLHWGDIRERTFTILPVEELNGFTIGDAIRKPGSLSSNTIRYFGVCNFNTFGDIGETVVLVSFGNYENDEFGYLLPHEIEKVDDKT